MIEIRESAETEATELLEIWERSAKATHDFLHDDDFDFYRPMVYEALVSKPCWVILLDGNLCGFMILENAMIGALFLTPDHIGQGLGTLMIEHAKELAIHNGLAELRVDVDEGNPPATAFYLARGFKKIGRSPYDSYGKPYPILHLAMPLIKK